MYVDHSKRNKRHRIKSSLFSRVSFGGILYSQKQRSHLETPAEDTGLDAKPRPLTVLLFFGPLRIQARQVGGRSRAHGEGALLFTQ